MGVVIFEATKAVLHLRVYGMQKYNFIRGVSTKIVKQDYNCPIRFPILARMEEKHSRPMAMDLPLGLSYFSVSFRHP